MSGPHRRLWLPVGLGASATSLQVSERDTAQMVSDPFRHILFFLEGLYEGAHRVVRSVRLAERDQPRVCRDLVILESEIGERVLRWGFPRLNHALRLRVHKYTSINGAVLLAWN